MVKKLFLCILLLYFFCLNSFAQRNDLKFDVINNRDGLPQNTINTITQDSLGFIWIGTEDGLCRYDGNEIKIYNNYNEKYKKLISNEITCLYSRWPKIWVGTAYGLNAYNVIFDKFDQYYFIKPRTTPNRIKSRNFIRKKKVYSSSTKSRSR